jgi:predicted phosphoribosyltransferase
MTATLHELKNFRNRHGVFRNRSDAGEALARMILPDYETDSEVLVLAIPSGGVPVGLIISKALKAPFDLLLTRKLQIPGNTEAGFGAKTMEGTVFLNEELLKSLNLSPSEIEEESRRVSEELEKRNRLFRGDRALPEVSGKNLILVDDGLASGYTMMAAVHSAKSRQASSIAVAVPTAPLRTIQKIEPLVDRMYCANVREESYFAVAGAYTHWHDLSDKDITELMQA